MAGNIVCLCSYIKGMFDTTPWGISAPASPFFGKALPNTFLENGFTREALEERIYFLNYRGEVKKK
jgi:hypothetical protein